MVASSARKFEPAPLMSLSSDPILGAEEARVTTLTWYAVTDQDPVTCAQIDARSSGPMRLRVSVGGPSGRHEPSVPDEARCKTFCRQSRQSARAAPMPWAGAWASLGEGAVEARQTLVEVGLFPGAVLVHGPKNRLWGDLRGPPELWAEPLSCSNRERGAQELTTAFGRNGRRRSDDRPPATCLNGLGPSSEVEGAEQRCDHARVEPGSRLLDEH